MPYAQYAHAHLCVCAQTHTIKPVYRLHALPNHPHVTYFHTKGHVSPPPALLLKRSPSSSRSTAHTFVTFLNPYNGRPLPVQVATTVGMYFFGVSPLGLPCIPVLCSCPSSPRLDGAFPPTKASLALNPFQCLSLYRHGINIWPNCNLWLSWLILMGVVTQVTQQHEVPVVEFS